MTLYWVIPERDELWLDPRTVLHEPVIEVDALADAVAKRMAGRVGANGDVLDREEAAQHLRVSLRSFERHVEPELKLAGTLVSIGGRLTVSREDLEAWRVTQKLRSTSAQRTAAPSSTSARPTAASKSPSVSPSSERSSPAERRAAHEAAEAKWRELTDGRVVIEHRRVKTTLTFQELYALYIERWESDPKLDINARKRLQSALIVRRSYGSTIMEWASSEAVRPDGLKRWRTDDRTPLQRITADDGPSDFLGWRLTKVRRKSMRKEKSNLLSFFTWCRANGYLASAPPVTLPEGKGTPALTTGRGVHIPLTVVDARKLVAMMPEWSSRVSRNNYEPFRVRDFFEFMWMTGLRPVTIERMEVGRNWLPGAAAVTLTDEDDKVAYGREFPLTRMATELLTRVAPDSGHIFGHHDRRKFVKAAAAIVFDSDTRKAELFGSYHLRDFVGTFLASRAGTNLSAASYVLGHRDLGTTSIYVHPDEAEARALLDSTEREMRRAVLEAKRWAKKKTAELAKNEDLARDFGPGSVPFFWPPLTIPTVFQSGREDSNLRPLDPQSSALTRLRYAPGHHSGRPQAAAWRRGT